MNKYLRYFFSILLLINLFAVISVAKPPPKSGSSDNEIGERLGNAVCWMVYMAKNTMGAVFLVLIILAAIVYAGGQLLGAETRARANVWATAMFTGAIIGGLIYLIVPALLDQLMFGSEGGSIEDCCDGAEIDPEKCAV